MAFDDKLFFATKDNETMVNKNLDTDLIIPLKICKEQRYTRQQCTQFTS